MIPLVPAGILALAGVAHLASRRRKAGVLTPDRLDVLEAALRTCQDPVKLRELAKAFDQVDLKPQGELLRRRAATVELPLEQKKARQEVFKKAMQSKNPQAILAVSRAYAQDGCLSAAAALHAHAVDVQNHLNALANKAKVDAAKVEEAAKVAATKEEPAKAVA